MNRSATMALQTPGAATATEPDEADEQAAQRRAAAAAAPAAPRTVEELEAALAAAQAENAALKAGAKLPQAVFEPVTPHGAQRLAESQYAEMTVEQLQAGIDAGEYEEPFTHALCKDGYYCRRGRMPA